MPYATETKSVKRLSPNVRIYAYANKKRISLRKYGNAYLRRVMVKAALGALGGFYRLGVFTCRNTPDMFFNANAEKEKKAKCMQSNNKCISAAQARLTGKSRLNRKK